MYKKQLIFIFFPILSILSHEIKVLSNQTIIDDPTTSESNNIEHNVCLKREIKVLSNHTIIDDPKTLENNDIEHNVCLKHEIKLKLLLSKSFKTNVLNLFVFIDDNFHRNHIESLVVYNDTVLEQITYSQHYTFNEIICNDNSVLKFEFNYLYNSFFINIKTTDLKNFKLLHLYFI